MRILADCWYQTAHIALPIPVVAAGGALLQTPRPLPVRYAKHRQCVPVVQGGVSISRVPIFVLLYPWHHHVQRQTPPRWKVHTVQIACAPPPERSHATRLPPPPTAFGTYVRRPHHTQPLHSAGALDPAAYGERVLEATMHNALSVLRSRCERECERKVHRDVMGGAEAFGSDVVLEDCDRGLVHTRQPTLWYPEHTAHQSTFDTCAQNQLGRRAVRNAQKNRGTETPRRGCACCAMPTPTPQPCTRGGAPTHP
jgi:hypothetical protein